MQMEMSLHFQRSQKWSIAPPAFGETKIYYLSDSLSDFRGFYVQRVVPSDLRRGSALDIENKMYLNSFLHVGLELGQN